MKHPLRIFFFVLAVTPLLAQSEIGFGNGEGVNGEVFAIVVQKDGKIVIGGSFTAVNGVPKQNLARLNPDGSLDETFLPQAVLGPNGPVAALLLLPDGGILVGGNFNSAGNLTRTDLVKFFADGTADVGFSSQAGGVATNGSIAALALQPDGSIIVGGHFTSFFGQVRHGIARLNPDGSLAAAMKQSPSLNGFISALAACPNGAVIAGGKFSDPGQNAQSILRSDR